MQSTSSGSSLVELAKVIIIKIIILTTTTLKNYIKRNLKIFTAYRILLVVEIKANKMGGPCSTYGGYKI